MLLTKTSLQTIDVGRLRWFVEINALLDIILIADKQSRTHFYSRDANNLVAFGKLEAANGDHLDLVFASGGCFMKGFAHESKLSTWSDELWAFDRNKVSPGLLDRVPASLAEFVEMPEMRPEETTFSMWRAAGEAHWSFGKTDIVDDKCNDVDDMLLGLFIDPEEYYGWFTEDDPDRVAYCPVVAAFSGGRPISELIREFGRLAETERIMRELTACGIERG